MQAMLEKPASPSAAARQHDIGARQPLLSRVARDGSLGFGESYWTAGGTAPPSITMMTRIPPARSPQGQTGSAGRDAGSAAAEPPKTKDGPSRSASTTTTSATTSTRRCSTRACSTRARTGRTPTTLDDGAGREARAGREEDRPASRACACSSSAAAGAASPAYAAETSAPRSPATRCRRSRSRRAQAEVRRTCPSTSARTTIATRRARTTRVVSIGLMEHVGPKNYRAYLELVDRCLAPGGVAFVHTIGGNRTTAHIEPWFDKYIFPNAVLPTLARWSRRCRASSSPRTSTTSASTTTRR